MSLDPNVVHMGFVDVPDPGADPAEPAAADPTYVATGSPPGVAFAETNPEPQVEVVGDGAGEPEAAVEVETAPETPGIPPAPSEAVAE